MTHANWILWAWLVPIFPFATPAAPRSPIKEQEILSRAANVEAPHRGEFGIATSRETVISQFTVEIARNPTNSTAYEYRGCAYLMNGDTREAIADLTKAIDLNPTNARAYLNRASAQYATGAFTKAIEDATECLRLTCA